MAVKTRKQKEQRKRKLQDARKRAEEHDSGYSPTAFKLPDKTSLFKWKEEGNYDIDVVPYEAGGNNPHADEGYLAYELTFFVHPSIGPKNRAYCCLAENWDESCPVCEHRERLKKKANANPKHIKEFYPKERQLFIIRNNDPKEVKKGLQIHEGPYAFGLGQLIDDKIDLAPPKLKDKYSSFHDPENGLTLNVGVKKTSFTNADTGHSGTFMKPVTLEMVEREDSVEELVDDAPNLEECLLHLSYDELKKIFEQTGDSDREEEEDRDPPADDDDDDDQDDDQDDDDQDDEPVSRNGKPAKKKAGKKEKTADDLGIKKESVVHHDEYGECEVIKVSKDGTSLTLEDEDGEEHMGVDPNECTLVDQDEEEDDAPAPKKGGKKAKPVEDDDEEEEDDSELEPEEEEEAEESEDSDDDDEQIEPEETEEDDLDDEETEEDDDEVPAPKKSSKKQPAKKGVKKR